MAERKDLNLEIVGKKAEFSLLVSAFLSLAIDLVEEQKQSETIKEVAIDEAPGTP